MYCGFGFNVGHYRGAWRIDHGWEALGLDLPMVHRHYDVFEIAPERMAWFGKRTVQFVIGVEGHIESLAVPLEPAVAPITFRRLP